MRFIVPILGSALFWTFALVLSWLATLAPCGFAPGAWCEEEGPNWFGATLDFLRPEGVLLVAGLIYIVVIVFKLRRRRDR